MDLGRSLRYPFGDPNWGSKVLIGTLVSLVPILNFAALGYAADVTHNVVDGRDTPLPEWDHFGDDWVRGLLITIIQFIWSLPVLLVVCPIIGVAIIAGANSNGEDPSTTVFALIGCFYVVALIVGLALAPLSMAAQARYAVTHSFSEAMPGPVLRQIRGHWKPWLTILLFAFAFGLVAGVIGACTFGLGSLLLIPLVFYMQLVAAHLYGQAFRESNAPHRLPPSMV